MAVEAVLIVMPLVLINSLNINIRVMSVYFWIYLLTKSLRNASFEGMHDINYVFFIPNAIRYLWSPRTDAIHELQQGSVFMLLCSSWYWNFEQSFCPTKLIGIMWTIFGTTTFHDYHLGVNVVYNGCRRSTSNNATSGDLCIEQQYQSHVWIFFDISHVQMSQECFIWRDARHQLCCLYQMPSGTDVPRTLMPSLCCNRGNSSRHYVSHGIEISNKVSAKPN